MIYGFSSSSANEKNIRCAQAAQVHLLRFECNSSMPTQAIQDVVLYAAERQVKILLLYNSSAGSDMPLGNLVSHIQRVGPTGTLWNSGQLGAGLGQWAPTHIEVGNEYAFAYRGNPASNAVGVANTVQRFYNAVGPTLGSNAMKFICEAEDGDSGGSEFLNALVATVPGIRSLVDGWVIHDYGPSSGNEAGHTGSPGTTYQKLARMVTRLNARGYTTDKIWVTESGISVKEGTTLSNNYGWNASCTNAMAGTRLLQIVRLHGTGLSFSNRIYCWLQFQGHDAGTSGNNRENFFGVYTNGEAPKGAFTSAAIQLATEFPFGGSPPPPPPPDPGDPPGFTVTGQTMTWGAVSGATSYTTFESDLIGGARYKTWGSGVTSFAPAARPPGTSINVGWSYTDALGDHWHQEQVMTWPADSTALQMGSTMVFTAALALTETAPQSGEITDVEYRMVDVTKNYTIPRPFQTSTDRELVWDSGVSKFFYKP